MFRKLTVLLAGLVLAAGVGAEIYTWVDAQGNVYYSDKPEDARASRVAIESRRTDPERVAAENERRRKAASKRRKQREAGGQDQTSQSPEDLAAQAYDAANLVLVQLARDRSSREGVRDGLLSTQAYPGVTGVLTMRSDGNASKRPFLLAIERGRIVPVE